MYHNFFPEFNHPDFSFEKALESAKSILEFESNPIANMANIASFLHFTFNYHWTGFYLVEGNQLVLGPFQGPIACTRIDYDKGVCGTAWKESRTIRVPNVHLFPGHIACSSLSNAELVIPIKKVSQVIGVLDIDSIHYDDFPPEIVNFMEKVCSILEEKLSEN